MLDERCKAYRAELDALKDQAIRRYNEQVRSFMLRIEHFHSQIVAQFRQCLATRKTRVSSFHVKLYQRADRYVACYKEQLEKVRLRKIAFVRNIFTCIYAGKAMPADFEQAIKEWSEEMMIYNQLLVQGFYNRVYRAVYLIECDYRCHYKCYFRSNCYVCQECTAEDHASVCHVPQAPNSDFAVSKLSTSTGTIVVTEASRPVPKKKSMGVTSTTNSTSTKSTRSTTLTTKDSSSPTMTGTDKSTNGALRLSLVLKKSSFANTQDTTKTQLKLKSINSMLFSENKP